MVPEVPIGAPLPLEYTSRGAIFALTIRPAVAAELLSQGARAYPHETGGVLVGHYDDSHHEAIVEMLAPKPSDSRAGRSAFVRGTKKLKGFLSSLWRSTTPRLHYIGEWHTHPDGVPEPSGTDRDSMWAIATDGRAMCPEPVLVILGGNFRDCILVGAFVFPRGRTETRLVSKQS
jgi:integrative and conjugative element protein (TIGR02256 family)